MEQLDKIFEKHLEDIYVHNDCGGNELFRVIYERDLNELKEAIDDVIKLMLKKVNKDEQEFKVTRKTVGIWFDTDLNEWKEI